MAFVCFMQTLLAASFVLLQVNGHKGKADVVVLCTPDVKANWFTLLYVKEQ